MPMQDSLDLDGPEDIHFLEQLIAGKQYLDDLQQMG
jgi:hypothetical protein